LLSDRLVALANSFLINHASQYRGREDDGNLPLCGPENASVVSARVLRGGFH
jgi:hypothetical protein